MSGHRTASLLVALIAFGMAGLAAAQTATDPSDGWLLADDRLAFEADFTIAGVHDEAQRAAMGRERQVRVAYAILALRMAVSPRVTFRIEANPAQSDRVPVPYIPGPDDRRTYFFPNQPEGRGVTSDPAGLYKVDYYKHPGLDPIIQQETLRAAYIDLHTSSGTVGLRFGRFILRRGLGVSDVTWFTAKDLTHIQAIDLVADNGGMFYVDTRRADVSLAAVSGNGNPYHDYGYFDFTDPTEDKNSAFGFVLAGRLHLGPVEVGASLQKNYINSRVEDATTFQLSKRNDDALTVFGRLRVHRLLQLYGQYSRYTWGIRASSLDFLPGPAIETPVLKEGVFFGVDAQTPDTPLGQWGVTVLYEDLSRDDSLVAWAASRELFGVTLGTRERGFIFKLRNQVTEHATAFFFMNDMSHPFPELSALRPISGPASDGVVNSLKFGFGIRLRIGRGGEY
jgi:hypothetical protein